MIIGKFDSATIINKIRILKAVIFGRMEARGNINECLPYGIDSSPIANIKVVYSDTSRSGYPVVIGVLNTNQKAATGELRTFATDASGAEKGYTWMKNDGTYEILGNDDNMVRYSALASGFNQLVTDFNNFVTAYNAHTHPGVQTGSGTSAPIISSQPTTHANINNAKIVRIKTISSDS